ncbi:MAG: lysozyme inhibitor LprI family protein [Pseudomonadota bacterium]
MFAPSSLLRPRAPEFHETPMIFRPLEPERPHPHLSINPVHISAAVSIACVMGMGLGLWMRADVDRRAAASALRQATPRAVAQAPAPQRVQIVLDKPDEDIAPPATSLMDVGVASPPVAQTGQVVDAVFVEAPSLDCRSARTLADQMVCVDPALAEADRRLSGAYKAALGSGADHPVLARSQARWLAAREAAARTSPEALASLYEKRISELAANENPARPAPSGVQEARVAGVDAPPVS